MQTQPVSSCSSHSGIHPLSLKAVELHVDASLHCKILQRVSLKSSYMLHFNLTFDLFILEDIMRHIITQMSGWHHPAPTTTIPTYMCCKAGG